MIALILCWLCLSVLGLVGFNLILPPRDDT